MVCQTLDIRRLVVVLLFGENRAVLVLGLFSCLRVMRLSTLVRYANTLPGLLYFNNTYAITLTANGIYEPICTGGPRPPSHANPNLDTRDPFYSSVTPQLYAIGCATVVSYLLVIILLITPRTFYVGGPGGGANFLGRHGMISGSYSGNSSVVSVGGRPWLQKVAAILVAISLTIATADSFRVAERQYVHGFSDAEALSAEVIDGMEIRVVRVISSTFLWLAQVQTLIRLFPRHKEKIMIKWAGFALIVLDTVFSCLDKFHAQSNTTRPRLYEDAIPALSYLFELALNLLYAAWVIFYSLSKHRFAFFHPKMRNICLVALLSLCAVLIPVVFFVLDIAKPECAGWGTYIRWVGSAAASVVVWEWVERIEALERDERKDGILGREIFDGDEMLEVTPSEEVDWPRQASHGPARGGGTGASSGWGGMMGLAHRPLRNRVVFPGIARPDLESNAAGSRRRRPARPTPPPAVATPISRADTTSAASTVYNVHYHPVSSPTTPAAMPHMDEAEEEEHDLDATAGDKELSTTVDGRPGDDVAHHGLSAQDTREHSPQIIHTDPRWRTLFNAFRRRRASLPREVASAQAYEEPRRESEEYDPFTEHQDEPPRSRMEHLMPFPWRAPPGSGRPGSDTPLPVTVIPARRRGPHAWSHDWSNDPNLLGAAPSSRARPGRPDLPVRVIQPQTQTAAPWDPPSAGEFGHGDTSLRYDPDAAALVSLGDHTSDPGSTQHGEGPEDCASTSGPSRPSASTGPSPAALDSASRPMDQHADSRPSRSDDPHDGASQPG